MKKQLSKLVINRVDIDQNDILSKKELKYIMGGYSGPGNGSSCKCDSSNCNTSNGQRCVVLERDVRCCNNNPNSTAWSCEAN